MEIDENNLIYNKYKTVSVAIHCCLGYCINFYCPYDQNNIILMKSSNLNSYHILIIKIKCHIYLDSNIIIIILFLNQRKFSSGEKGIFMFYGHGKECALLFSELFIRKTLRVDSNDILSKLRSNLKKLKCLSQRS